MPMMTCKTLCRLLPFTLLMACAANKQYLKPAPMPEQLKRLVLHDKTSGDSMVVMLDENHLPVPAMQPMGRSAVPFTIEGAIITTGKEHKLQAWTLNPTSAYNGCTVLLFHGNGGNILSNLAGGGALARNGFRVVLLDYSGYGYSTGKATRDNLLLDGEAALQQVSSKLNRQQEKLILYGQSLGGNLAAVVASRHPDWVDALVTEGAFTSHKAMAKLQAGGLASSLVAEKYSAVESLPSFHKSLLLIHSKDDEVIPYSMGQELFAAANEPKTMLTIEKEHLAGLTEYTDKITEAILQITNQK